MFERTNSLLIMKKAQCVGQSTDSCFDVHFKPIGNRRFARIKNVQSSSPPLVKKAHSQKRSNMAMPVGSGDAIQVDSELDRDSGGVLVDNLHRVQMIVRTSPQRMDSLGTPVKDMELQKALDSTPNWLVALVNKKRSLVPMCFLIDDIMSKYTARTLKSKRTKSSARIVFDQDTCNNIAEVVTFNPKDDTVTLDLSNFEITHTSLRVINRETKEH